MTKLNLYNSLVFSLLILFLAACSDPASNENQNDNSKNKKIFTALSATESGIDFANNLKEDSVINYFTYPYIYMGGGVAVGDLNNDGLSDIYFTGNMVQNKLYLNKGDLHFEDITEKSNTAGDDRWMTGVTMVDINADGWLDIYVSVSGKFTTSKNLLFINNGATDDGIPTFSEAAEKYGLADEGRSTQATFFDYDKDGDLDVYIANYPYTHFKTPNYAYKIMLDKKEAAKSDRLYRNNGNGKFENVTLEAGLQNFGLSLSATIGDLNNDGWEDIYVSNDFASPDFLYINNGDGTFKETVKETTQHTAFFGMGADIADFNNDGLLDILQMDMTPEDNRRNKANMASMNPAGFHEIVNMDMHYQYMQNVLQLNQGITKDGLPHFSDIARIAGISSTDWSWAGLFADLDNDGWKDIFITNGTRRDINNKDYFNKIENANYEEKKTHTKINLTLKMPSEKVNNYVFKNNGNLDFSPVIEDWGLSFEGFSNGAAYADLDNDGDLEMIINNIDDKAIIFENSTTDRQLGNFLKIQFKGTAMNPLGLGTKVHLKTNKGQLYQHQTLTRGFQSSVAPIMHFGLGQVKNIDEIKITWTDGKQQILTNIKTNQTLVADYQEANNASRKNEANNPLFADATQALGIDYQHKENVFNDFQYEVLLPHAYSQMGPGLAVGDINGDGLDDFFIGGAIGRTGAIYSQNQDGSFKKMSNEVLKPNSNSEDMGASFFDADADGDLDLYVVSGGNEHKKGAPALQDRFYINDGKGNFTKAENVLPSMLTSGSIIKAADYDKDGDLDLFVGGRIVARSYPLPAQSYILKNELKESGSLKFTDITAEIAPGLEKAGLVTAALWVDYNQDEQLDLVVVGEWMPITFYKNEGGKFENQSANYDLENTTGWWYSIEMGDFDKDGDMDFIAGNLGLNYKYQANEEEPFDVYAYDYDKNGKLDIVLGYYNDGVQYPVRGRQCSSEQIPTIKYKYKDYNSFAAATLKDIYTDKDLKASLHYEAKTFASAYIENLGNEGFKITALPNAAQLSSINGIVVEDFNKDGNLDALVAGNLYTSEVETTRNDASYGNYLEGDGKGNFKAVPFSKSGFYLKNDVKGLAKIKTQKGLGVLAANNNDYLKAIIVNGK